MFNKKIERINKIQINYFSSCFYIYCLGKPRFIYLILLFDGALTKY
jgi:hypothetical protein